MKKKLSRRSKSNNRQQRAPAAMSKGVQTGTGIYRQGLRTANAMQGQAMQGLITMAESTHRTPFQPGFDPVSLMTNNMMRMTETMGLLARHSRVGVELARRAMEVSQGPLLQQSQATWIEFWSFSMKAAQSNVQALSQMANRMTDWWDNITRRTTDTMATAVRGA